MDSYNAIKFIYQSYVKAQPHLDQNLLDIFKRHPDYCRQLLRRLDLSLSDPPSVLITGSKGKGSTSALIANLLQSAGYKTGLFTGPHLVDFCERIRINWSKIPESEFVRLVEFIRPEVEGLCAEMPLDHYMGPVGTTLAVALLWFREQGADFHVLECGRGALADDVNVIRSSWSVLTPIMLEHPDNLGPTLLDIAANKMAVIKPGQKLCVSYAQTPEIETLLKSMCKRLNVPLKLAEEDFAVEVVETSLSGSIFKYKSVKRESIFKIPLPGRFQAFNAGVSIALAEEAVPGISDAVLQAGFDAARWPGRCEIVPGEPMIILDGAINAESAGHLRELLEQAGKPLYIVFGVPADKDWQGALAILAPLAESVWLTKASNTHLIFPPDQEVLALGRGYNKQCKTVAGMTEALAQAIAAAGNDGAVIVAGTQSLIRDAKIEIQAQLGRGCNE